jgi:hypothetical protein
MRTKRFIDGLNNSQKIRVIINGIGFHTTVEGAFNMAFRSQQMAVTQVLQSIGWNRRALKGRVVDLSNTMTGMGTRVRVYGEDDKLVEFDVQIDLI